MKFKTNKQNFIFIIEAEYIDYRDILKVNIKIFSLISLSFILKNSSDIKSYESNFIFGIKYLFFISSKYNIELEKLYIKFNLLFFINITYALLKKGKDNKNLNEVFLLDEIFKLNYIQNAINEEFNLKLDKPIDIIIPVYNGFQYLEDLFNSIFLGTHIDYRLIIVEDKSSDDRVLPYLERLNKDNYPNCKDIILIQNEENLGFVKSVNKGANLVNNHFVLLNTDVVVPNGWLERFIYPIINYDNIASVTPFTNSGTICSFPNLCEDNKIFLDLHVNDINNIFKCMPLPLSYDEITTAVGFCMAINKNIFDEIGEFDIIYGKGYCEENDWCMRASNKNYKHLIAKNLYVWHNHGGSFLSEEKANYLANNHKILISRYPEYDKLVSQFIKKDRLKLTRYFFALKLIFSNVFNICVIFSHERGGGTEVYLKKFIEEKISNKHIVIIISKSYDNNHYLFSIKYTDFNYKFLMSDLYKLHTFFDILNINVINDIIINSIVDFDVNYIINFVLNLKRKFNSKLTYLTHDYFCICPNINLLYKNKYFCGVPEDINKCYECLNNFEIRLYRYYFKKLLQFSDDILVFSESSKNILLKVYNNIDNNITILPHKVDWIKRFPKKSIKKDKLHIGILGAIGYSKGFDIITDLLKISLPNNYFMFYSIGYFMKNIEADNLFLCGKYKHENLVEIVEKYDIDIFIIPSIWPETFSYTTEEIILMQKPIICFNLGAQAERVSKYDKGYIAEDISAKSIYEKLLEFNEGRNNKI